MLLTNTFDVNIFLHLSASNPDEVDPSFVLIAAFLTNSSFIPSKIIEWIIGGSPLIIVSSQDGFDWGCFYFKEFSIFSISYCGRILFVNNFNTPLRFSFPISSAHFLETPALSRNAAGSLFDVNLCRMVSASNNKDLIWTLSHNCSLFSMASKWSQRFDVLLGFCNNNTGIVCIALKLIDLSGVSCVHAFKSLVTSLMYFFPAFPVGKIKRFFHQKTIFS